MYEVRPAGMNVMAVPLLVNVPDSSRLEPSTVDVQSQTQRIANAVVTAE
jgi:hypothetical protein